MINWIDQLLKRIGLRECEHDFYVRTSGKMTECSICKRLVLIAEFTRANDDE